MTKSKIIYKILVRRLRRKIYQKTKRDIFDFNKTIEPEKKYFLEYGQNDYEGIDVRWIWEQNRFQDLISISVNGEKADPQIFISYLREYINKWVSENPYGYGLNWVSPMETAIRAANLLLAMDLIGVKIEYPKEINKFLKYSFKHIIQHIEVTLKAPLNNHYLSNIAGIIYILIIFKNIKNRDRLLKIYIKELENEIKNQVFEDGVNFENSCGYHKFVTEIFFYTGLLCEKYSYTLSDSYWMRVNKMLEYITEITMLNGITANFGDSDNGHWHKFVIENNGDNNQKDYLISLGGLKFWKDNLANHNLISDTIFQIIGTYFNITKTKEKNKTGTDKEYLMEFKDGGVYIIKEKNLKLVINTKNSSKQKMNLHKHNDVHSFELVYKNRELFVDSGTYCYTVDKDIHNSYRSTKSHNTLMIDDIEQEDLFTAGNFALPNTNVFKAVSVESDDSQIFYSGKLEYLNKLKGVTHQRTIEYNKMMTVISIIDKIEGNGKHKLDWYYHIHPSVQVNNSGNLTLCNSSVGELMEIKYFEELDLVIEDSYYSEKYGKQTQNKCLHFRTSSELPFETVFKMKLL